MDKNCTIRYFFRLIFPLLLLALVINSCQKEKISWDSDLLVPILNTKLDIRNIFGDTNVVENPDQTMELRLESSVDMLNPDKVIVVHDTLSSELFNIPLYLQYGPGDQLIDKQNSVTMDLNEMELDLVKARVATMKFYVTNTVRQPLRVKYEMISATKDGKHFVTYEDVPAATASGPSYSIKSIHLDGYEIDMTGADGTQTNTVVSRTWVWLHPDADSIWITPQDSVFIVSTFDELKVEYVHGYFGQQDYSGEGSTPVSIFRDLKAGSFDLAKVTARLDIENFTGMDMRMSLDKLSSYRIDGNSEVVLQDPLIGQNINIERAVETSYGLENVISKKRSFLLDNSNLDELIENQADSIRFKMAATINPLGNVTSGGDFMYFDKTMIATLGLNIPLKFSATNMLIEKYESLDIGNAEKLKSGSLILYVDNLFPLSFDFQVYILDQNKQVLDSLFEKGTNIAPAQTDGNGYVVSPSKNELLIPLPASKIELLRQYKDVLIRARVNTAANKMYQLYQNHNMKITLVADVKYEI